MLYICGKEQINPTTNTDAREIHGRTMAEQAGNLTFAIIKPDAVRAGH
jgi:hypothetical protein